MSSPSLFSSLVCSSRTATEDFNGEISGQSSVYFHVQSFIELGVSVANPIKAVYVLDPFEEARSTELGEAFLLNS